MKVCLLIIALISLFCGNAFCKDKVSSDGYTYHSPCQGDFKGDTLSKHKYQSKIDKHLFATGYCVAIL